MSYIPDIYIKYHLHEIRCCCFHREILDIGIISPGEGITIYPIQSSELTQYDDQPDRWLDVRWDIEEY